MKQMVDMNSEMMTTLSEAIKESQSYILKQTNKLDTKIDDQYTKLDTKLDTKIDDQYTKLVEKLSDNKE